MSRQAINDLHALVKKLQTERDAHEAAIAEIDAAFADLGVTGVPKKRRGRRPGRPKKAAARNGRKKAAKRGRPKGKRKAAKKTAVKKSTKRKRFKVPGHEALVVIVKKAGAKGITSGDIVKQWKNQGRGSGVHVEIGKLVKAKKLKRENLKGQRGSLYRSA